MAKIQWLASFETGIPAIDDDHRQLVEAMDAIHSAFMENRCEDCRRKLKEFVEAARTHFLHEEALLARVHFPGLDRHIHTHTELIDKADRLMDAFAKETDRAEAARQLDDMIEFLISDILEADVEFKSYVQDSALARQA